MLAIAQALTEIRGEPHDPEDVASEIAAKLRAERLA
jgi:hypothetical protein